jgi:hypothetical protein
MDDDVPVPVSCTVWLGVLPVVKLAPYKTYEVVEFVVM